LSSLTSISKRAPSIGVTYCLTKPGLALVQCQPPPVCRSAPGHLIDTSAASAKRLSHIYLLRLSRQRG